MIKTYIELFFAFLKMGSFAIGGGYAMLPLIREEVVGHGWMNNAELINFMAVSESTPGSMSVNMASYVGLKTGGLIGQLIAILGVMLPSFLIMLMIAIFYDKFIRNKKISYVLEGLKPAVVAMVASAIITVGMEVFIPEAEDMVYGNMTIPVSILIFGICLFLNYKKKGPILMIAIAGVLGILAGVLLPA